MRVIGEERISSALRVHGADEPPHQEEMKRLNDRVGISTTQLRGILSHFSLRYKTRKLYSMETSNGPSAFALGPFCFWVGSFRLETGTPPRKVLSLNFYSPRRTFNTRDY